MRGTTITINGQLYDAKTGLPMSAEAKTVQAVPTSGRTGTIMSDVGVRPGRTKVQPISPQPQSAPPQHAVRHSKTAHAIHNTPQRSTTLHRAALQRPVAQHALEKPIVKRSPAIQKFSPHLGSPDTKIQQKVPPLAAQPASQQKPANTHHHQPKETQQLQGSALKEKLIADKMANIMPQQKHESKSKSHRKYPRLATIASGISALVLLGGYLTYLNLPNLSLRVAASQAGVAATYPTYQPSGYSFAGPVAYSSGEVRVNFKSNTNDFAYSVVQRESNWDSQAVRDNYVVKENKQYTTIQEGGITIYLVNNKAVWVNGGVLYSVEGNAPLSGEQIQKIASSTL